MKKNTVYLLLLVGAVFFFLRKKKAAATVQASNAAGSFLNSILGGGGSISTPGIAAASGGGAGGSSRAGSAPRAGGSAGATAEINDATGLIKSVFGVFGAVVKGATELITNSTTQKAVGNVSRSAGFPPEYNGGGSDETQGGYWDKQVDFDANVGVPYSKDNAYDGGFGGAKPYGNVDTGFDTWDYGFDNIGGFDDGGFGGEFGGLV